MRAAAAASFHLAPATNPAHRRGSTTDSCSLRPAPTARPPRFRSLARRAPLARASLGISHDKGSDISDPNVVGQNDLLIVGPGVLGRIIAEKWQKEHPGCKVYGQTASKNHHSELTDLGIIPSLKGTTIHQKVSHVIFCAPPSGSDDYPGDVRLAASNWSGEGSFLFTSSTALYDCSDNSLCNEDCPSVPIGRSPRTDVLLKVENVVLEAGGCVLRLAGLYKIDRGAHVFWLRKGTLDTQPDHIINQIHYEDAASLAIAIMKKRLRSRIFLGCDNKPLSRQEIMDAVNKSGKFDTKFEGFTGTDGPLGKRMENSKTRAEIGWEPKYPSFTEFLGTIVRTRISIQEHGWRHVDPVADMPSFADRHGLGELLIKQAVKPQGWELAGSYNGLQRRPGQVALFKKKRGTCLAILFCSNKLSLS